MTLIKKIQLAAKQNDFEVYISGNKRKLKFWNVGAHKGQLGLPYKAITGDYKMFPKLCSHLIQQRKGTEGYKFDNRIGGYWCKFIDGQFTYVISKNLSGSMILVYKNK